MRELRGAVCREADGAVYPCDFYALDQYRLGNLVTDDFSELNRGKGD